VNKYKQYIKERKGLDLYEDEYGFFTYQIQDNKMFIQDLFVLPEFRNSGVGESYSKKIDKLALDNNCTHNVCTVCVRAKNYIDSLNFIKKMGYQVTNDEYTLVYLIKEL
jgi:GNAT superfamily N-acetyltransferase